MPIMQGQVVAPPLVSATDGNQYNLMQGKQFDLIVSLLHGKHATQNVRGNMFMACLTSASALVAPATNATPNFVLWNPAGNNRFVNLVRFYAGYVSGTPAAATFGYSYVPNAGNALGTAAPLSALTTLTVNSCLLGQGYSGNVKAGSAATITGTGNAAAIVARWSPFSTGNIASASINAGINMVEDFDGTMILPPGTAWYPHTSAASVATYMLAAVWSEIPYP